MKMTATDNISLRIEILRGSHAEHWKWEKEMAKFVSDPKDPRRERAREASNAILKRISELTKLHTQHDTTHNITHNRRHTLYLNYRKG